MRPEELGATVVALVDGSRASVAYGDLTVDVPAELWVAAVAAVRDDPATDCRFFDWLTVVDELPGLSVLCRLWSVRQRHGVLLRTAVSGEHPHLASLTPVFAGAGWPEREAYEMFGVVFDGHPDLRRLLLPPAFEGNPLRKDFVLAARAAQPWPGAHDPGERPDRRTRRQLRPPGVPEPGTWGPGEESS